MVTGYCNFTFKITWSNAIWFNFNWSTLSGTGNMFAPENTSDSLTDVFFISQVTRSDTIQL